MLEIVLQQSNIAKLASIYEAVKGMPQPNISKPYLDVQAKVVAELWQKIDSAHTELFKDVVDTEKVKIDYFKNDEHDNAFNLYMKTLTVIETRLSKIIKDIPPNAQPVIQLPENINLNATQSKSNIKLKPINIPVFSGDYKKWTSFINMFDSLIHKNDEFDKLQKMHYLKSCLSGDAERIVSQYSLTEGNYDLTYNALRNRYHNEVILIDTHIITIISQPDLHIESSDGIKELLDVTTENLHALNSLNIDTDSWDPILLLLLTRKLDQASQRLWELTLKPKKRPTLKQFLEFLEERFNALGCQQSFKFTVATEDRNKSSHNPVDSHDRIYKHQDNFKTDQQASQRNIYQTFHSSASTSTMSKNCSICHGSNHNIFQCDRFRGALSIERINLAHLAKLCKNCLWEHKGRCSQNPNCRKCGKYHHTFLHVDPTNPNNRNTFAVSQVNRQQHTLRDTSQASDTVLQPITRSSHHAQVEQVSETVNIIKEDVVAWDESVLLATAIVLVRSIRDNSYYPFRCLLDQASENNYVSEEVIQFLGLKKVPIVTTINGLGGVVTGSAKYVTEFEISSRQNQSFAIKIQAPIVSKISNLLPSTYIQKGNWKHLEGLQLADPEFGKSRKIDILLGAPVYGYLLLPGLIKTSLGEPIAQNTEFGWILSGPTRSTSKRSINSFHLRSNVDDQLKRFFEQEELSEERLLTQEEKDCEKFFNDTVRRNEEGRVIVALPFKRDPSALGSSKGQAITRLMKLESRLAVNHDLNKEYSAILDEFEELNHTTCIGNLVHLDNSESPIYYLPHHPVFKPESSTTKTRVVFDASAKTTTGVALNDLLMVGPTIQQDLVSILMRWRSNRFVFSADIAKMYRQIEVRKEDRKYQRFVFRKNVNNPIKVYEHNRVTFGVASATYLAIASLRFIATEGKERYPEASTVMIRDFYMDDVMSGGETVEETIKLCEDLRKLSAEGKFELRKFISNSTEVLSNIPEDDRELTLPLEIDLDKTIKTLGVRYHPGTDTFQFKVNLQSSTEWPTKRNLLSDTAKLFDPLGWLAPTIIRAKIFFQELWQEGLTWDQKLPHNLAKRWLDFRNNLFELEKIVIKRWIGKKEKFKEYELHGFSDASEKAFSAVVYSRIVDRDGSIHITMLTSKTRVASLKPMTIPRLELKGAVLLAHLMNTVAKALNVDKEKMHAWTDSKVVLGWLRSNPSRLKTFVANRIVEIHGILNVSQWYHIEGENNPADCASRGISPAELVAHELWWNGPDCLRKNVSSWQQDVIIPIPTLELKSVKKVALINRQEESSGVLDEYMKKYSNLQTITRKIAIQLRFINNCRPSNVKMKDSIITAKEIKDARNRLIQLHQEREFCNEIYALKQRKVIQSAKSKILALHPFLDEEGFLRVGGRLEKSDLTYERKHPMILSPGPLSDLLIREAHFRCMHGGTKLTMNLIRELYWIINLRRQVKKCIARCVICFRFRAVSSEQIMAVLPRGRVRQSSPFTFTGVDYAGPFEIKASNVKSTPMRVKSFEVNGKVIKSIPKVPVYKGYIALFVCFATKAIHLEVVSDLTTKAFLAAYDRFTSRRGFPERICSDNSSTFIGAKNILSDEPEKSIVDYHEVNIKSSVNGTQWQFITPRAPHQGGLHEAGVKSMKHHLKRVVGDTVLTFEELSTVTARIEACLNSRPLCPMSDDPNDLGMLTAGHFLIGKPMLALPTGDQKNESSYVRDRWMLVQKLQRDIWRSWNEEYLSSLQVRSKWRMKRRDLKEGNVVLYKEDDISPTKWPLARVVRVYPSKDGNIRSVRIKTQSGEYDRPIHKLCLLPISDNEECNEFA